MRLDKRFIVVVTISLGWAFLVSAAFYHMARNSVGRRTAPKEKAVVVAAKALEMGAVINPEALKLVRVPEESFPKGGFSRLEDVVDRPVISPVLADEPLVEGRIGARGSGAGVAPLIPPGMRAMSVRVNDVVDVAGFVLPGMRVDVLVTGRPPGRDDSITTTVLQNIAVLSAGQILQADSKSQSIKAAVVTLLVTPAQAEVLTLADNEGHIQLVLRNSADHEKIETPGWLTSELYAQARRELASVPVAKPSHAASVKATTAPPPPPPAPDPLADGILVIRGDQKVIEPVGIKALELSGARPVAANSAGANLAKPAAPVSSHPAASTETTPEDSR
jgi:pilus assembly protein CpaB